MLTSRLLLLPAPLVRDPFPLAAKENIIKIFSTYSYVTEIGKRKTRCCGLSLQPGKSFLGAQFSNAHTGLFQSYSYQKSWKRVNNPFLAPKFCKTIFWLRDILGVFQFFFSSFLGRSDNTFIIIMHYIYFSQSAIQ